VFVNTGRRRQGRAARRRDPIGHRRTLTHTLCHIDTGISSFTVHTGETREGPKKKKKSSAWQNLVGTCTTPHPPCPTSTSVILPSPRSRRRHRYRHLLLLQRQRQRERLVNWELSLQPRPRLRGGLIPQARRPSPNGVDSFGM
jgi:hypothetical protein